MTPEAKMTVMAMPTLAAAHAASSLEGAIAMSCGLLGGWAARVVVRVKDHKPWSEIWRDMLVSVLISAGSIIATLVFARLLDADTLGIAAIGFSVTFAGVDAIKLLQNYIFAPIWAALRGTDKPRP